ncbi:MAG: HupE/UreJ family protein [Pseudoxanthomonas sp.]
MIAASPRGWLRRMLAALLLVAGAPALAHDVPPSTLMLDIGRDAIDIEAQLPLSELGLALHLPLATRPQAAIDPYGPRIEQYLGERLQLHSRDGRAWTLRCGPLALRRTDNINYTSNDWLIAQCRAQAPAGASTEIFRLDDSAIIREVISHKTLIYVRRDLRNALIGDEPMAIGMLTFGKTWLDVDGSGGSWWQGFGHLFSLGMHHIAEGTDHLLFLLALLLPAPLLARGRRWGECKGVARSVRAIVGVVSGFTLGHSCTLALAAFKVVTPPTHLIEVLIAVSILVSALHAWRPLFAGREFLIASGFGLVHGLAFAEVLAGLNFDRSTLVLSLLGFNLGIEAMQLLVVAVLLPMLLLLANTRHYRAIRLAGAGFAGACALGWIGERAFALPNPLAPVVNWLAPPPWWFVAVLGLASVLSLGLLLLRSRAARRGTAAFP